jgi:Ni/Fe-hydrogenase subunit HybB-like protein
MIPDLATLRDRAKSKVRRLAYGIFSLGWTGSNRHWHRYERAYLLLAALATPLVLSVHSVVSFDFAVSQLPGWHTTIFPPYFVAGAIFSGFAMVVTLIIPARKFFGLSNIITIRHLENMNKIICHRHDGRLRLRDRVLHRLVQRQPLRALRLPQPRLRPLRLGLLDDGELQRDLPAALLVQEDAHERGMLFIVAILVNVGMWFERFVITVTSLSRDFLPSSWGYFTPTWVDVLTFVGSFGLFFTLFLLVLPLAADGGHRRSGASPAGSGWIREGRAPWLIRRSARTSFA